MPSRTERFTARYRRVERVLRAIPAPIGCLLVVLLLPVFLVGLLVYALVAGLTVGGGRGGASRQAPRTPAEAEREVALCSLVRSLALEAAFTREQALSTPVIAGARAGPPVAELLDEALARGWIVAAGDAMHVTSEGRRDAEAFLRRAGL